MPDTFNPGLRADEVIFLPLKLIYFQHVGVHEASHQ